MSKKDKEIYDDQLFDLLSKIIDNERTKANATDDTEQALHHCELAKRAVEIRSNISVTSEPKTSEKETSWMDTPMSNKQFWHDILTMGAPVIAAIGTIVTAVITTSSAEKVARQHDEARYHQLALLMGYEKDNLVDKRQIEIINSLNK